MTTTTVRASSSSSTEEEEEEEEVSLGRGMTPEEATALCEALAEDLTHLFDARRDRRVAVRAGRLR
jgi:hypothetical protein